MYYIQIHCKNQAFECFVKFFEENQVQAIIEHFTNKII